MLKRRALIAAALMAALLAVATAASAEDDQFIRGYAAAILQRDFDIAADAVSVSDGVVTVRAELSDQERERLTTALTQIGGVQRVVVNEADALPVVASPSEPSRWAWLPRRELFRPLIADPRWPRFAVAYQYYIDEDALTSVAAVSFGETFPLLQYDFGPNGALQVGIQGSVFAIFDLASDSFDLVNADYFGALPISYALGNFSSMFRVYHRELAPRRRVPAPEGPAARQRQLRGLRPAVVLRVSAMACAPTAAAGTSSTPTRRISAAACCRPAASISASRSTGVFPCARWRRWICSSTSRAAGRRTCRPNVGLQFGTGRGEQRSLRLLLQYYNGKSPNGQFYDHHIQYIGLGAQLDF